MGDGIVAQQPDEDIDSSTRTTGETPATTIAKNSWAKLRAECEDLRKFAEVAEAVASALRRAAGRAKENQDWYDEQA
ncbi:MAG: hypothetical protein ACE5NG_14440, partial [bacterium]